jgi:hypothetical protein
MALAADPAGSKRVGPWKGERTKTEHKREEIRRDNLSVIASFYL